MRGGGGEESLLLAAAAEGELIVGGCRRRQQEAAEVDGEQVGAVAAPHGDRLEQAAARHAHLQENMSTCMRTTHADGSD